LGICATKAGVTAALADLELELELRVAQLLIDRSRS
jgi:hypothetical protein